jgi:hypothetical protein
MTGLRGLEKTSATGDQDTLIPSDWSSSPLPVLPHERVFPTSRHEEIW